MITTRPAKRCDLLDQGVPAAVLDQDLRARRTAAVFRGVYVEARHACGLRVKAMAALAVLGPAAVVTGRSAAVLLGLRWLPQEWLAGDMEIHVAVAREHAGRHRPGLRLHRRRLAPCDIADSDGIASTSVARTLVELAREPGIPRLLVVQIVDGALRDGRTTLAELAAVLARMPGERGVARARGLIGRSREGVDSPAETQMRLQLEDCGLGIGLDVNIEISDDDGLLVARGELGSKKFLLWAEYDGYEWHNQRQQFRGDRVGDRWLTRRGWQVMRFVDEDLKRPTRTAQEWRQAIADAPARIAALDPSRSPEIARAWRMLGLRG